MNTKARVIIEQVSLETGIPTLYLTWKGRTRSVRMAKKMARQRLRDETNLSWREIDLLMGGSGENHRI